MTLWRTYWVGDPGDLERLLNDLAAAGLEVYKVSAWRNGWTVVAKDPTRHADSTAGDVEAVDDRWRANL